MRKMTVWAAAVVVVLLGLGLYFVTSNRARVVRVQERNVESIYNDFGDPGETMGDQYAINADLVDDNENRVGEYGAFCVLTSVPPGSPELEAQCHGSLMFEEGRIVFSTLEVGPFDPTLERTVEMAVMGGTGAYRFASGYMTIIGTTEPEVTVYLNN